MKVYAGFIRAERGRETITRPECCVADNEMHARMTLNTRARQAFPSENGWEKQQGYCRLVPDELMFLDERIIPPFLVDKTNDS